MFANKGGYPLSSGYHPELDSSPELNAQHANYYQGQIFVLQWIVKLGRINILVPVAHMSQCLTLLCKGHLEQVLHILVYLKQYGQSTLVFDDYTADFDETCFIKADWSEYYPDAAELIPPHGKAVTTMHFVHANHARCHVT